ncbi:MAG: twin-arginine translocation signal domain-containing protein, partial [Gemmatimonadota bacterium]
MASRRDFLQVASAAAVGAVLPQMAKGEVTAGPEAIRVPLLVSTWPFGQAVNRAARQRLEEGGSGLDAVEAGIHVAEADAGNHSVGIGGHPNAAGVVQLDA